MPRNLDARVLGLAAALGGCVFDAGYHGHYTCRDGQCPSGLVCTNAVCVAPGSGDAGIDTTDAPPAALTCADPGPFPPAGGTTAGSTASRTNTISATCNATIMNGPDAVYRVHVAAPATIMLTVSGSFPVTAYAIAPCAVLPATPACVGSAYAAAGSPAAIAAPAAGDYFIVVDGINAGLSGTYTLDVGIN